MYAHWPQSFSKMLTQTFKLMVGMSLVLLGCVMLYGCGQKAYEDPFKKYRNSTALQLFDGANAALVKKHYSDAVKQYSALDAIYPFGQYAKQGQLYIIYANFKNGDMLSADLAAQRYIRLYPLGPNTDYAYYMSALANFSQGQTWLSKRLGAKTNQRDLQFFTVGYHRLLELTQSFPHSPYFHAAVLQMHYVRNIAAQKNYHIAQFYFARKAYIASINRCNEILVHIPNSSSAKDAVQLIIHSYQMLGMPDQAALYQGIYTKTFG
jgi:outer membrane protein assembly factor BamD